MFGAAFIHLLCVAFVFIGDGQQPEIFWTRDQRGRFGLDTSGCSNSSELKVSHLSLTHCKKNLGGSGLLESRSLCT